MAQGAYAMSAARTSERGIRPGGMPAVAIAAAGGAALAIGLALVSSNLRYPGVFALQRATIILAPVLVGIYWRSRRPASRFGDRLIALGFLAVPVSLEATSSSWLHTVGVMAEAPLFFATFAVILAYPGGLLEGRPERSVLRLLLAGYVLWYPAFWLLSPRLVGSPVAMCIGSCPANALHVASHPEFLLRWQNGLSVVSIVAAAAMMLIIAIRFVTGLAPNRRTLLAGSLVSVVYLAAYIVFVSINFNHPRWLGTPDTALRWTLVVAAALLPFGFLAGLAQAEIFAGQVLRATVGQAVNHEPIREVEATLAGAFGDPGLRLVFWIDSSARWIDSDGAEVEAPAAAEPKKLTHVVRTACLPRRSCTTRDSTPSRNCSRPPVRQRCSCSSTRRSKASFAGRSDSYANRAHASSPRAIRSGASSSATSTTARSNSSSRCASSSPWPRGWPGTIRSSRGAWPTCETRSTVRWTTCASSCTASSRLCSSTRGS